MISEFYLVIAVTYIHPASEIARHLQTPNPSFLFLAKSLKTCRMTLLSCNLNPLFLALSTTNMKNRIHSSLAPTFTDFLGNGLKFLFRLYFFRLVSLQITARTHCIYTEEDKLLCNLQGFTAQSLQRVCMGEKIKSHWNFFFSYFEVILQVPSRIWPHTATAVQEFLLIMMVKLGAYGLCCYNITGLNCYDSLLFLKELL